MKNHASCPMATVFLLFNPVDCPAVRRFPVSDVARPAGGGRGLPEVQPAFDP